MERFCPIENAFIIFLHEIYLLEQSSYSFRITHNDYQASYVMSIYSGISALFFAKFSKYLILAYRYGIATLGVV